MTTIAYVAENNDELWLVVPGFDDLLLTGDTSNADGSRFELMAMADDTATWGSPLPIDVAVQRWMADGAVTSTQGQDDREIAFTVRARAITSADLAAGEAALALRANRPCLLKWVTPEGAPDSPTSVFEVWTWHLSHTLDLDDESQLTRMYALTMTAKPSVRSDGLTIVEALSGSVSPTLTEVDDCTSTAAWIGLPSGVTESGGAVHEQVSVSARITPQDYTLYLSRPASISMTTTPYLMLDVSLTGRGAYTVQANGVPLVKAAQIGTVGYWQVPDGATSISNLLITAAFTVPPGSNGIRAVACADVSKTDTIGFIGTGKQLSRVLPVGGSVRTSGSLQVASPGGTPLGTVLLYTAPDNGGGYTTALRPYRSSGNTVTSDSTAVSGKRETLVVSGSTPGPVAFTIPANVLPEAQYVVLARMFSTTAITATVAASVFTGAFISAAALSAKVTWATANTWVWAVLGSVAFPNLALPPESQVGSGIQIAALGTGTVYLDDLYLLDDTHGAVSLVNCGTATRLWVDAPDVDPAKNRPALYVGTAADRSDAASVPFTQVMSLGDHDLDPNGTNVFSVTDGVSNADVSASFYHRWHTHAGD